MCNLKSRFYASIIIKKICCWAILMICVNSSSHSKGICKRVHGKWEIQGQSFVHKGVNMRVVNILDVEKRTFNTLYIILE